MPEHSKAIRPLNKRIPLEQSQPVASENSATMAAASLRLSVGAILHGKPRGMGSDKARTLHETAENGLRGGARPLPHLAVIQESFGSQDVTGVRAYVGPEAAMANQGLGAKAYASKNRVAFKNANPSLRTAAHEAAHIIQQRAGVDLQNGIGRPGDRYEQDAEAVAELTVRGESAAHILDRYDEGAPNSEDTVQFAFEEKKEQNVPSFDDVMSGRDPNLREQFKAFLLSEFAIAKWYFYELVTDYLSNPNDDLLRTIFLTFLDKNAPKPINLSKAMINDLWSAYFGSAAQLAETLKTARQEIYELLKSGPWQRFQQQMIYFAAMRAPPVYAPIDRPLPHEPASNPRCQATPQ